MMRLPYFNPCAAPHDPCAMNGIAPSQGAERKPLNFFRKKKFNVIVTDMRMPGMDGAQLLTEVRKIRPETIRIILSGQAEDKAFLRAVGSMHQFLSKPCDFNILKKAIANSLSLKEYLRNENLKKLLTKTDTLPTLPELYLELLEELQSENSTLERIGEIVSKDIGMTAKILQVANSAFFGMSNKISSPTQAVEVLGLDFIQALVITYQAFKTNSPQAPLKLIWDHSVETAGFAILLARREKMGTQIEINSFTASMLHDIGKVIFMIHFKEKFEQCLTLAKKTKKYDWEIEQEIFEADHAQVGAYLIGLWGLPDQVIEAIAYHEYPSRSQSNIFSPLTLLYVSNFLIEENPRGYRIGKPQELDEEYLKSIGISDRIPEWRKLYAETKNQEES